MSGFEVAGIALGAFPIIASALRIRSNSIRLGAVYRWRFYTKELNSLMRTLEIEHLKLQTVFERLLIGIVPDEQIDTMINDPFGSLWKNPDSATKIRKRLGRSVDCFESVVQDIRETMEEIGRRLGLGADGNIAWISVSGIKRELKRAQFAVQRSAYDELITHIRDGTSRLEELLQMGIDLEPKRQERSQNELYRVIRDHCGTLRVALKSALTCRCAASHRTGFKLMRPYLAIPAGTMKTLSFHIALSTSRSGSGEERCSSESTDRWDLLELSTSLVPNDDGTLGDTSRTPVKVSETASETSRRTRLRFFLPSAPSPPTIECPTSTAKQSDFKSSGNFQGEERPTTKDLCSFLQECQAEGSYRDGYITDKRSPTPRLYRLHPCGTASFGRDWTLTSLRSLLVEEAGTAGSAQRMLYGDGLRLAWMVASAVVQLRDTSWLPSLLTHNDIFLVRQENAIRFCDAFLINASQEPTVSMSDTDGRKATAAMNSPSPTALGILLIELILGKTIDPPRLPEDTPHYTQSHIASLVSDFRTLKRLLGDVETIAGSNYSSAVRSCLKCEFYDDGSARREDPQHSNVFLTVLQLLERDVETILG